MGDAGCLRRQAVRWRLASLVTLAALLTGAASPLALAGDEEADGCCGRGRCCCAGARGDEAACVRTACPCTRSSDGAVLSDTPDPDLLLPQPVRLWAPSSVRLLRSTFTEALRVGVPSRPDPPPWPEPFDRSRS